MRFLHGLLISLVFPGGCGPGVADGEFPILDGYVLSDAGGNERAIAYYDGERLGSFVIDARVDGYVVDGKKIIAARRPVETVIRNGITDVKLLTSCEYWIIDTESHLVERIDDASKWPGVACYMGETNGATVERGR